MLFNFLQYLSQRTQTDPYQEHSIQVLTGGIVNVTVRATTKNDSIILKYAPPFIAAVGPDAPFDVYRQTIEARALSLFVPSSNILHHVCVESNVLVPELLYHDDRANVLAISDLGAMGNLSESFRRLLASKSNATNEPEIRLDDLTDAKPRNDALDSRHEDYYRSIGQRIGHFFALLHSPRTLHSCNSTSNKASDVSLQEFIENPGNKPLVFTEAIEPLKQHFLKFVPDLIPTEEAAHQLYRNIEENFWRETSPVEECLVLGDCWTGAILVDDISPDAGKRIGSKSGHGRTDSGVSFDINEDPNAISERATSVHPRVGVIDWEFASMGRGLDGDMSQFLAHLQGFKLLAEHRECLELKRAVEVLMEELMERYWTISVVGGAPWALIPPHHNHLLHHQDEPMKLNSPSQDRPTDPTIQQCTTLRSFLLSHAAEIINCAFWKSWDCGKGCCGSTVTNNTTEFESSTLDTNNHDNEFVRGEVEIGSPQPSDGAQESGSRNKRTKKKEKCKLIRRNMGVAIEYLRRAGDNVEEFIRNEGGDEGFEMVRERGLASLLDLNM